ncbi:MAG: amidohydrolase family protein [Thermoguttaceae bacterium]
MRAKPMILDTNAYLGPFAFRRLRHNTAAGLLRLMDEKNIDQAMVSSAAAITYRNPQAANEDLADEVRPHRDRLIPMAVINPFYAGWRDDLEICCDEFGIEGLRLYPKWHNYSLSDPNLLELVEEATGRNLPVSIPVRVEDSRQRSWLVDVPDIPLPELVELVKACPRARFVLVNGAGYTGSALGKASSGLPANYSIEISRLTAAIGNELAGLLANLGPDRLVFGSGMPFTYADPSLLKLDVLDADDDVKEKIRSANAARLLRPAAG